MPWHVRNIRPRLASDEGSDSDDGSGAEDPPPLWCVAPDRSVAADESVAEGANQPPPECSPEPDAPREPLAVSEVDRGPPESRPSLRRGERERLPSRRQCYCNCTS